MKTALFVALFGALIAVSYASCPLVSYHSCIKDDKPTKCKAVEVCEKPYKEKCGYTECEYPYTCATHKKEECKHYAAIKGKCEKKPVCKEVKYPCGYGACGYHQDCVKDTKCYVKDGHYGRKLMGGGASAKAVAVAAASANGGRRGYGGASAHASAYAAAYGYGHSKSNAYAYASAQSYANPVPYIKYAPYYSHGRLSKGCYDGYKCGGYVCEDLYTCVAKEACKAVVVKKCVKSDYKPGVDLCYGGHHFDFYALGHDESCGGDYCGEGYECASVYFQDCDKKKCGNSYCDYGYECDYEDKDCDDYAYLDTICKDVYEPVCVLLPGYLRLKYKAPCKTVYECDHEESACGNEYCGYGYVCAVDYKKVCDAAHYPTYYTPVYVKPYGYHYENKPYYYYPSGKKHYGYGHAGYGRSYGYTGGYYPPSRYSGAYAAAYASAYASGNGYPYYGRGGAYASAQAYAGSGGYGYGGGYAAAGAKAVASSGGGRSTAAAGAVAATYGNGAALAAAGAKATSG